MHKSATKCNETLGKWCKNKHGASKIIDTLETYHSLVAQEEHVDVNFIKTIISTTMLIGIILVIIIIIIGHILQIVVILMVIPITIIGVHPLILKSCLRTLLPNKLLSINLLRFFLLRLMSLPKVDSLAHDVDLLKQKVMPQEVKESNPFAAANAIQVRIDDNVRMLAELHARWEREDELAKQNNMTRVYTISTNSNVDIPADIKPPTINDETNSVEKATTFATNLLETTETISDKSAEIFLNMGNDGSVTLDNNGFDFDD
jgi:hypothetical protein